MTGRLIARTFALAVGVGFSLATATSALAHGHAHAEAAEHSADHDAAANGAHGNHGTVEAPDHHGDHAHQSLDAGVLARTAAVSVALPSRAIGIPLVAVYADAQQAAPRATESPPAAPPDAATHSRAPPTP